MKHLLHIFFAIWLSGMALFFTADAQAGHQNGQPRGVDQALIIPHPTDETLMYLCGTPMQSILGKDKDGKLIVSDDISFDCDIIRRPNPENRQRCTALPLNEGLIRCPKSI